MSKCAVCTKFVALPEERRACSRVFHIDCFRCGILDKAAGGCDKKMTLDGYTDRKGAPFCKSCYGKLYGPKGFITGSATFNSFDESNSRPGGGTVPVATSSPRPTTAPVVKTSSPVIKTSVDPAKSKATSGVFVSEGAPRPDDGRIVNDRNARVIDTEIIPKADDIHELRTVFNGSKAKTCAKCRSTVTLVEERLACDQVWHIDCFVCGGKQSDGCHKKLTLQGYTAHKNDPYCTSCYNKLFGAKGFVGGSATISTHNAGNTVASTSAPSSRPVASVTTAKPNVTATTTSTVKKVVSPEKVASQHTVNDRNIPAMATETKNMPKTGSVQAALQNLKKELPRNN